MLCGAQLCCRPPPCTAGCVLERVSYARKHDTAHFMRHPAGTAPQTLGLPVSKGSTSCNIQQCALSGLPRRAQPLHDDGEQDVSI